jgi:hypothetical protein
MKPTKVNILGVEYSITYHSNPAEVDIYKRESLWGQIDYWTSTIRVYDNGSPTEVVFQALLHEVLHGIANALKLELNKPERHDELDLIALALTDILFRNGWLLVAQQPGAAELATPSNSGESGDKTPIR